jgi:hypothetical protein
MIEFSLTWRTPVYLLFTLAILAALTAINAIVVGTGATLAGISGTQKLLPITLVQPLTAVASIVCAVAITFGITLFLAEMSRPTRGASPFYGRRVRDLTWAALVITAITILAGAALMSVMVWLRCLPDWLRPEAFQRCVIHFANVLVLIDILIAVLARVVRWRNISNARSGMADNLTQKVRTAREKSLTLHALFYVAFLLHIVAVAAIFWLVFHGAACAMPFPALWNWLCGWPTRFLSCLLGAPLWECIYAYLQRVLTSYFWVWPFLFLISTVVRGLLVQYVGDVTAYISSNKIDRFDELRKKIKEAARESAAAVYLAKAVDSNSFEYQKIAIVGHSLGSVIAYDTLNRLIADDALAARGTAVGIACRTCLFLTFGSPLDKIAFFFSVMGKNTAHIREQLAAVVQPLIQDYANRPFPGVNVFSRNDIICGHLDFYDLPNQAIPPGVDNVPDEEALIPLVAHVEYWNNLTVWKRLLREVIA